jgi:hypothetical protein
MLGGWIMTAMQFLLRYLITPVVWSASTEYRHQERVEVYRIKHVNADNEDDSSDHKDVGLHQYVKLSKAYNRYLLRMNRPELTCVLDIGQHDSITFSGHKELLITRFLKGGHQLQVVAFHIIESIDSVSNKSTSQIVWQTRNDDPEGSKIALTSALPLELDSIIQGYCGLSGIYMILIIYRLQLPFSGRSYSSIFCASNREKV